MISINNLTFRYHQNAEIISSLTISTRENGIIGLIGRNGCGKTTLFDLIMKNRTPNKGSIKLNCHYNEVILLSQSMHFPYRMTVKESLEFVFLLNNLPTKKSLDRYFHTLSVEGEKRVKSIFRKQIGVLSNGELRWLNVTVSLFFDKKIYLLDEPTAGVDPEFRYEIWKLIQSSVKKSKEKLFIISGHLLHEMASYTDELYFMKLGTIHKFLDMGSFIKAFNATHADEAFVFAHR